MPIRFRCSQCDRLLGIARRKAGTQIRCPQCGEITTVPTEENDPQPDHTLRGLDDLLGPAPVERGAVLAPPEPALITVDASLPPPEPSYPAAPPRPVVKPRVKPEVHHEARPQPPAPPEDSLFERDVDALLGIARPDEALQLAEAPRAKPVQGMDAMSLDDGPSKIVLSSERATLIVVAAALLMLLAFVIGFAIRSTL